MRMTSPFPPHREQVETPVPLLRGSVCVGMRKEMKGTGLLWGIMHAVCKGAITIRSSSVTVRTQSDNRPLCASSALP
jgi:hypothetical protein